MGDDLIKNLLLILVLIFLILCAIILAQNLISNLGIIAKTGENEHNWAKKPKNYSGGKEFIIRDKYPILINKNMLCKRSVSKHRLVSIYQKWRQSNTLMQFNNISIPKYNGTFAKSLGGNEILMLADRNPAREYNSILVDEYGILTNYFIEKVRLLGKNDNFSLLDAYNTIIKKKKLIHASGNLKTYTNLRDTISTSTHLCETFPASVVLGLLRIFQPRRILDMSAGWGDRMIGAIAYGADYYVGVDPNSALAAGYRKMAETFTDTNRRTVSGEVQTPGRYSLIISPFESVQNEAILERSQGQLFDLMISSPPYFAAEQYSADKGQSYLNYDTVDKWLNGFMKPSIDKSWALMGNNSTYIMCINDVFINGDLKQYTEDILQHIAAKPGAKYVGMLKYRHYSYIVPLWIFHKCENVTSGPYLREYDMVSQYDDVAAQHARDCWLNGEKLNLRLFKDIDGRKVRSGAPIDNLALIKALIYGAILS